MRVWWALSSLLKHWFAQLSWMGRAMGKDSHYTQPRAGSGM